jgi:hypothetical protein
MSPSKPKESPLKLSEIKFAARPDTVDFRDLMYIPTLVEVPASVDLKVYQEAGVPILNQGQEGACTGFGLASVANYLLRKRGKTKEIPEVSPRMLYEMAKRYDEWPGEGYSGSSARGAMKGWHKHGVCSEDKWKYIVGKEDRLLSGQRAEDASARPLGAYFRVNHKDLVAMHCAIAEVGILYATAHVHDGWSPGSIDPQDGRILYDPEVNKRIGGHAFVIVAYDERGFWIQNSWGRAWGLGGFAHVSYDDWLANGTDIWVARLGVPVRLAAKKTAAATTARGAAQATSYAYHEMRPHLISLGNDGLLKEEGIYSTSVEEVKAIFKDDIPRITKGWKKKRIFLYAHGGLVPESVFLLRIAEYRAKMLESEVYPLGFIWNSDIWNTASNLLKDVFNQIRPEGPLEAIKDFFFDRLDETLEILIRKLPARIFWDEMKENAILATTNPKGGARFAMQCLADLAAKHPDVEVHIGGHSAGSIFMAPVVRLLTSKGKITGGMLRGVTGLNIPVATCTLWAPGITMDDFNRTYLPAIRDGGLKRFALYTLWDETEQADNVAKIYNKSLLYLVANALEDKIAKPLLGLAKDVEIHKQLKEIFEDPRHIWIKAPTPYDESPERASKAMSHGAFDDDEATVASTLARMLDPGLEIPVAAQEMVQMQFAPSPASLGDRRKQLDSLTRKS